MSNQVDIDFESDFGKNYERSIKVALPTYEQLFPLATSFLRTKVNDNARLLVVGAGGGAELLSFNQANPDWQMTGVDPSEQMINLAKEKVNNAGITDKINLFHGLTNQLPLEPIYEGATCILVLHFLPDDVSKLELLKSIAERLKPGSPLVLVSVYGNKESVEFQLKTEAVKENFLINGYNPEEIDEGLENLSKLPIVTEERIKELLYEAGFHQVTHFFTTYYFGGGLLP
ncbi:class I SAM-dependent methyltransferase [Paenibacillus cremeus]|uniref:Class I SAM-dependent methyltransferase n=1 Tax=Paenibacillus cremeus TaxID=2163881 RepID=A0A559JFD8_9BACL|nr:class I SAM-dependent methyltransferase [Paenibacillus cremeus]TVX98576.1 class I SAM-dependent methyltransferase [Paenibacillus cremeus]